MREPPLSFAKTMHSRKQGRDEIERVRYKAYRPFPSGADAVAYFAVGDGISDEGASFDDQPVGELSAADSRLGLESISNRVQVDA